MTSLIFFSVLIFRWDQLSYIVSYMIINLQHNFTGGKCDFTKHLRIGSFTFTYICECRRNYHKLFCRQLKSQLAFPRLTTPFHIFFKLKVRTLFCLFFYTFDYENVRDFRFGKILCNYQYISLVVDLNHRNIQCV